jgi:hypothetical protein
MTQSILLSCAWLTVGIWMAIRPGDLVALIERLNHAKWENANLAAIRAIGAIWVVGIVVILVIRLVFKS